MNAWSEARLGDLCSIKHGYAFKGEHFDDEGEYLLLTPGNFRPLGGLVLRDGKDSFYHGEYPGEYLLDEGDLVIAMTDLKQDAPILGSTIRIPESGHFLHNQRLGLVQDVSDRVDIDFLYYVLNDDSVRWWLRATATGSTVRHTAPERICEAKIKLPSLAEQEAISAFLSDIDDQIENNRLRVEILEVAMSLLYREWFVHFRFPGCENVEFVASELGLMPRGWKVETFAQAAQFINGFAFKPTHWLEDGLPIVKIKELKNGISAETPRYHGNDIKQKFFVDSGSVLFSWSADLEVYVWSSGPALLNQHLFDVRPRDVSLLYIYLALRVHMPEFRSRAQGTTMRHIKRSALDEVQLAVAPQSIREEFESRAGPMIELRMNLEHQIQLLVQARNLLRPRLVSGDLDISHLRSGLEVAEV